MNFWIPIFILLILIIIILAFYVNWMCRITNETNNKNVLFQSKDIKIGNCNTDLNLQKLWEDHVQYTREYVLRIVNKLPGIDEIKNRLLQNQIDLANEFNTLYPGSFDEIKNLLTEHIILATQILNSIMNNKNDIKKIKDEWYINADQIAIAIKSLNDNYDLKILKNYMEIHLDTTTKEISAILKGNSGSKEYDEVVQYMLKFSNYLLHPKNE